MNRSALIAVLVLSIPVTGLAADNQTADASAASVAGRLAARLLETADMSRGLCAVLGSDDGRLPLAIVRQSGMRVHAVDPRPEAVAAARKVVDVDGLWVRRIIVERGSFTQLPWADNTIDLVVATGLTDTAAADHSLDEIKRVLRPGGMALLGPEGKRQVTKPKPAGTDDWTHWQHRPDNNPASTDTVIKAPYVTQWLGGPYYIPMPSVTVTAGGRRFLATGHISHHRREWPYINVLIAQSSYNGEELWRRDLPKGYMVHRSAFIAGEDVLYMIDGDRALMLDAKTGEERGEIRLPDLKEKWEWMALVGNTLYVLSGPGSTAEVKHQAYRGGGWGWGNLSKGYYGDRVPWGFGQTLSAYDVKNKRTLWQHREEKPIDSRAMMLGGGSVFLYAPDLHFRALDDENGSILWTNDDPKVRELMEQKGRGLISTPGFRSSCFALYTPNALVYQAQTRMNVIALSSVTGELLWQHKKVTNNPTQIYLDGQVILGIGRGGSHLAIDPKSGEKLKDLRFRKAACTRLTASPDSIFCRGEGLMRYDRATGEVLVDGAMRPACNDGAIPADGLLHLTPWQCDCGLSLIGGGAFCSAGDFRFDRVATNAANLERGPGGASTVAPLTITEADWPTYRGSIGRGAASKATVPANSQETWRFTPRHPFVPTPPAAAGSLLFVAGFDGKVRAIDAASGRETWTFLTGGAVRMTPTIADGRLYVGSGDGFIYCLEAATGRLLWRFRAAPIERRIMVYGALSSTWPVNTGVLVRDGVAYAAAGIIDSNGTYVYALDAVTGEIRWQNNSTGHLDKRLRKGISAQGVMTVMGNRLVMASGNQVSPAAFDLKTGKLLTTARPRGWPRANRGQEVGVFRRRNMIFGGRLLHSAPNRVANKDGFGIRGPNVLGRGNQQALAQGRTPPAWNDETFVLPRPYGAVICTSGDGLMRTVGGEIKRPPNARRWWRPWVANALAREDIRWREQLERDGMVISIALAKNAVLFVRGSAVRDAKTARRDWDLCARDLTTGKKLWDVRLPSEPLPGGLAIDRAGRTVVALLTGDLVACGT